MSFSIPFEFHQGDHAAGMTVVRPVARGGNGDLYLVRDDEERLLALKVVRKTDNDGERNGIEQCRAVSSHISGLVPVLNTGKLDDGRTFCVMPLADNLIPWPDYEPDTLANRIRRSGRIPTNESLNVLAEILKTVGELHEAGLFHCDIKPENILFIGGKPMLSDYSLLSDSAEDPAGTVGFVPPEMVKEPGSYSPGTCDLYAAGKILYCAWTGKDVAFFPSIPREIALPEIGLIRPLYMKACSIVPAKRFQTAGEFLSAVENTQARMKSFSGAGIPDRFKNRWAALLVASILLLCAIGLANIYFLLQIRSGRAEQEDRPENGQEQSGTATEGLPMTSLNYDIISDDEKAVRKDASGAGSALSPDPLVVTTDRDSIDAADGANSLREALAYAQRHGAGSTISFEGVREIRLSSSLPVTQNVILDGGENGITLIGPETEPMFQVTESRLTLKKMSLISDYSGDGGGILDAGAIGRMDLFSVKDGGNAKLLWNVSCGFDINLNDGTHLRRMRINPPVSGDGSHVRINAGTILEDTSLAGCDGRRGGDYEVRGTLKNASVTEYGDIYLFDGGICEDITARCASFYPRGERFVSEGGFVIHSPGGKINGMKIEYGAVYGYEKGDILTGTVSIGGAVIAPVRTDGPIIDSETDLVFDLTQRSEKSRFEFNVLLRINQIRYYSVEGFDSDVIVDDMKSFEGARSYTVRVGEDQAPGTYRLAANAAGFAAPVSLAVGEDVYRDVLSVGKIYSIGNTVYTLGLDNEKEMEDVRAVIFKNNVLTLTVGEKED